MEDVTSLAQPSTKKVPTLLKVYAVLLIVVSALAIPLAALTAVVLPQVQVEGQYGMTSIVIIAVSLALSLAEACYRHHLRREPSAQQPTRRAPRP